MAELNLKQIIDRLNMEFTGDTRGIWFSGMTIMGNLQKI